MKEHNQSKLTNKNTLLWVSALSIVINLFKAVYVFQTVSFGQGNTNYLSFIYSTFAMGIVEFAIIVFLANGKVKDSIGFALLSVIINLYYFNGLQFNEWRINVVEVIFSFLLPYISARMAHVYMERVNDQEENGNVDQLNQDKLVLLDKNEALENNNREYITRIEKLNQENEALAQRGS